MPVKCVNDEDKTTIVQLYLGGELIPSIAQDFAVSYKTIVRVLMERGTISRDWRSEIHLNEAEAALITKLREGGIHPTEMVCMRKLQLAQIFAWFRRQPNYLQKSALKLFIAEHNRQQEKVA